MTSVGVVGASGYGGGELLRLLDGHPALKVATVTGGEQAGRSVAEALPHLAGLPVAELTLQRSEPEALAGCELVFLATPHEPSLELAPALVDAGARVIDLSGAYRLDAATFGAHYGQTHPDPGRAPAPYGLPELFRDGLADAPLVAVPGCYPTAALLALAPLADAIDPESIVVAGMSGTSGAGRKQRPDLQASHAFGNAAAYGAPRHRHEPEIAARFADLAGTSPALTFVPHLVPTSRGQLCTVVASLVPGANSFVLHAATAMYHTEPFVTVLAEEWPATAHVAGGNGAHLRVAVDHDAERVVASCAIDNLVKGAAGQAIQCANAVLGLPETTGLSPAGVYP
jgi:N-acetyl-gamma-glutamyl-phosphate reductase